MRNAGDEVRVDVWHVGAREEGRGAFVETEVEGRDVLHVIRKVSCFLALGAHRKPSQAVGRSGSRIHVSMCPAPGGIVFCL